MAVRKVIESPANVLTTKTKEVEVIDESVIELLDDLYDTMVEYDGVGIAAPQINVPLRVAIVELGEDILEMINPIVLETRGEAEDFEARCILHEIDHLDGILFDSKMTRQLSQEELDEMYGEEEGEE